MVEIDIIFHSVDDVNDFVNSVKDIDCPIELEQGRYKINSKSVMGIFSLDITHPMKLKAYTDDKDEVLSAIKEYVFEQKE